MDLQNAETKPRASFRPYVSIDIETTGISMDCSVLQIAAIFDDGVTPIDELQTYNQKIKYHSFHGEPVAMRMNAKLIEEMSSRAEEDKAKFAEPSEAAKSFLTFMAGCREATREYDEATGSKMRGKVIAAGKNYASFDDPRIRKFIETFYPKGTSRYDSIMSYKTLDAGSMYYLDFGYNPSLSAINELTGRTEVTHDALDDALDIVYAVRNKAGML